MVRSRSGAIILCLCLLGVIALALPGCGSSGEQMIKGTVIAVNATNRTFSVQATNGKRYDFKASSSVDLVHIKVHMDEKALIEVRYSGSTPPYTASSAH